VGKSWKRSRNYLISGFTALTVLLLILGNIFWKRGAEHDLGTHDLRKLVSIAVLPFDNISQDANDEYLADGMTDEMISKLSKIKNFRVIARTSVMRYKETLKSVTEIGEELDVGTLLEGTVRKVANNLRITVHLVDVKTQAPIWSNEYNRELDDVFAIQDDVSVSIVNALEVELNPLEKQRIVERPIPNILAYQSYLKARQGIWFAEKTAMQRAERELKKALEIVGENELLYATSGCLR